MRSFILDFSYKAKGSEGSTYNYSCKEKNSLSNKPGLDREAPGSHVQIHPLLKNSRIFHRP